MSLPEVTIHLAGREEIPVVDTRDTPIGNREDPDLTDVKGQHLARRALEVAAAGAHNILFIGPPGTGKSMLARRLTSILPIMSETEALETAAVDSILGQLIDLRRWRKRPFRAPHHTASAPAIVGGGSGPHPGEISRAHNGVLFLDELPEFNRNVLEVMREPLETGSITISRATRQAEFPADVHLVCAMNPCPCGEGQSVSCRCDNNSRRRYARRVSGPVLDRVDLVVHVERPTAEELLDAPRAEASAPVAERVAATRQVARVRGVHCNAALDQGGLEEHAPLSPGAAHVLEGALATGRLSARGLRRVRAVARTIRDLDDRGQTLRSGDVAEALLLRARPSVWEEGDRG